MGCIFREKRVASGMLFRRLERLSRERRERMEKRTAARQIWLLYFNRVLQENHLISPAEARRMQRLILHAQESPSGHLDRP